MCGIVGYFSFTNYLLITHDLKGKLLDLMSRRGPDHEGQWCDGDYCWLGFRRLAILDLSSAGNQPMVTQDGRYAIVFNGELYNFRELRLTLESQGVQFKSKSDTEVVLYALAEWGEKALTLFNGMFALAFYDKQEKCLLLARDHAGIKPLYYLQTTQGILFGSQYDQILHFPQKQFLEVDYQALGLFLRLGYIPDPYAIMKNTHMLEPGSWLKIDVQAKTWRGCFFEFPRYQNPDLKGLQAYEAVDEAVTRAVQRQTISDVPIGAFLSGGIDSPLVVAKLKQLQTRFTAFTVRVDNPEFDESQAAGNYAKVLDVPYYVETIHSDQALSLLDDVISSCGEPFADYSIFPTLLITRLARQEMTVMLSGDGGDELFWGYTNRMGTAIRYAELFRLPFWQRKLRWWLLHRPGEWNTRYFATAGEWYRSRHVRNFEEWLKPVFPALPSWPVEYQQFDYSGWNRDQTAQWVRWNEFTGHLREVLLKVDRASMHNSLEVRVPLLDKEVIETACRVDWDSCLNLQEQEGKIPLRQSLRHHVKQITSGKRGFSIPMSDWLKGPLKPLVEDKLLRRKEILGLEMNNIALAKSYKRHLSGQYDHAWGLWIFLSLALWEEKYIKS